MSQEVRQTELKAQTQQLLDGPLKHIRAAAIAAALLPLASVAATPASAQTVCGSGGICGTVFNDVNNNGIQDVGDTGIGGVMVFVCQKCDGSPGDMLSIETNPNGTYSFDASAVPPVGPYTVSVLIPNDKTASPPNAGSDDSMDSDGTGNGSGYSVAYNVVSNGLATDFGLAPSEALNPGT